MVCGTQDTVRQQYTLFTGRCPISLGSPRLVGGTINRKRRAHASKQVVDITCPGSADGTIQLDVDQ